VCVFSTSFPLLLLASTAILARPIYGVSNGKEGKGRLFANREKGRDSRGARRRTAYSCIPRRPRPPAKSQMGGAPASRRGPPPPPWPGRGRGAIESGWERKVAIPDGASRWRRTRARARPLLRRLPPPPRVTRDRRSTTGGIFARSRGRRSSSPSFLPLSLFVTVDVCAFRRIYPFPALPFFLPFLSNFVDVENGIERETPSAAPPHVRHVK